MKKAERARRFLAEFKRSPNIPESVIAVVSSADNGDSNDSLRWLGRTAAAFLSQWEKVTSQCSDFHQIMTRVKAEPWTGSPKDEEFVRAGTAIRNRSCGVFNLNSVLRNANYPVGKSFPFVDAYHFLVAQKYFDAKPEQESHATIWNAARCVRYNERVEQS
jgi:glutathione S-transferase